MTMSQKEVYHALRRGGMDVVPRRRVAQIHYIINERFLARQILDDSVEDGKIGVGRNGMDCDCTKYDRTSIIDAPKGAVQFVKNEQEHREWLDGPESTRWSKPSHTIVAYHSRDLALEAWENGHPHVVYLP